MGHPPLGAPYSAAHTKDRHKEGTDVAPVVVGGMRTLPCAAEAGPVDGSNTATVAAQDAVLDADNIRS
jgi:hypothetical protein